MGTTDTFDLGGKVALVTGASRGIGEAIARLLAAHGAHLVVSSRKADACARVVGEIVEAGGSAEAIACHIGEPSQIADTMSRIEASHGRLDILVNNAATNPYFGPVIDADARDEAVAQAALAERQAALPPVDPSRGLVLVTGGTGFLGRAALEDLRSRGWRVRALVRRIPSARQQVPGIDYVECDLGRGVAPELLRDVSVVAHLAAETAGNQAAHERNSVVATRNLLDAMQAAGVKRLINISSVAVLKPGPSVLEESSPVDRGNLSRGPYVWAKAEAGRAAARSIHFGVWPEALASS